MKPPRRLEAFAGIAALCLAFAACATGSTGGGAVPGPASPTSAAAPGAPPAPEPPASGVDGATRFLDGIPRCASVPAGLVTARDARELPEGTKIAVRGVLLHNPKWDCPPRACKGADGRKSACCNTCRTRWFVVDPADAARPYMSRSRLYPRTTGQPELQTIEAQDCDVPKVNAATPPKQVILTGTFQGTAGEGGGSQLVENAQLCTP